VQKPHAAAIDKDIEDGQKVGVSGTPAFFINGRMLSGAQPFEKFKELIDEELASAEKS
jgi:protein-disulfide isomerase